MEFYGDRIKKIRQELGLSQSELAQKLGIHKQMVSDVERGKQKSFNPQIEKKLISFFSLNPHWLLEGRGEMFMKDVSSSENGSTQDTYETLSDEERVLLRYFRESPVHERLQILACIMQCLAQHKKS
ncbi:hypothetical protein NitYY0826_C1123 [Nitratiruptor sp. YY08-26]|nr:hypothetical protein NitYY0813_C1121 [Nitratiruptor sp. YY08-13]BCD66183.1 hypothetical protein NitYY0826_C1123 [Nitratiruptor sp. YY08-26]